MRFSNGVALKDFYFISTYHPEDDWHEVVFQCVFQTGLTVYVVNILKFISSIEFEAPDLEVIAESELFNTDGQDYNAWSKEAAIFVSNFC